MLSAFATASHLPAGNRVLPRVLVSREDRMLRAEERLGPSGSPILTGSVGSRAARLYRVST